MLRHAHRRGLFGPLGLRDIWQYVLRGYLLGWTDRHQHLRADELPRHPADDDVPKQPMLPGHLLRRPLQQRCRACIGPHRRPPCRRDRRRRFAPLVSAYSALFFSVLPSVLASTALFEIGHKVGGSGGLREYYVHPGNYSKAKLVAFADRCTKCERKISKCKKRQEWKKLRKVESCYLVDAAAATAVSSMSSGALGCSTRPLDSLLG